MPESPGGSDIRVIPGHWIIPERFRDNGVATTPRASGDDQRNDRRNEKEY